MTRAPRTTAGFLAIIAAALAVGGCGSDKPEGKKLPAAAATELSRQLTSIDDRVASRNAGACEDIFKPIPDGNIDAIDNVMAKIPAKVDPDIRAALEQSIDRLKQLIDSECREIVEEDERERQEQQQEEEEPAPEEKPTTPTTPTTEEPVDTQPTTPEPKPTPEPKQDEKAPPGNGPAGEGPPGQTGGGGANAPSDGEDGDG